MIFLDGVEKHFCRLNIAGFDIGEFLVVSIFFWIYGARREVQVFLGI